jgi:hypothetical protein
MRLQLSMKANARLAFSETPECPASRELIAEKRGMGKHGAIMCSGIGAFCMFAERSLFRIKRAAKCSLAGLV